MKLCILFLIMILSLFMAGSCSLTANDQQNIDGTRPLAPEDNGEITQLTLYFRNLEYEPGDPDSKTLVPVTRNIVGTDAVARATVGELFRGPSSRETDLFGAASIVNQEVVIDDIYIQGGLCVVHLDYEGALFENGFPSSAEIFMDSLIQSLTAYPSINAVWVFQKGAPWQAEDRRWSYPLTAVGGTVQFALYFRDIDEADLDVPGRPATLTAVSVELESDIETEDAPFSKIIDLLAIGFDSQRGAVISQDNSALGFVLRDGVLTVNLAGSLPQGEQDLLLMQRALVYTFTELPEIDRVLVTMEDEPWSHDHLLWDIPLGREDLP